MTPNSGNKKGSLKQRTLFSFLILNSAFRSPSQFFTYSSEQRRKLKLRSCRASNMNQQTMLFRLQHHTKEGSFRLSFRSEEQDHNLELVAQDVVVDVVLVAALDAELEAQVAAADVEPVALVVEPVVQVVVAEPDRYDVCSSKLRRKRDQHHRNHVVNMNRRTKYLHRALRMKEDIVHLSIRNEELGHNLEPEAALGAGSVQVVVAVEVQVADLVAVLDEDSVLDRSLVGSSTQHRKLGQHRLLRDESTNHRKKYFHRASHTKANTVRPSRRSVEQADLKDRKPVAALAVAQVADSDLDLDVDLVVVAAADLADCSCCSSSQHRKRGPCLERRDENTSQRKKYFLRVLRTISNTVHLLHRSVEKAEL